MIKTITFAIVHFSVAFSVAYLLTGSIAIGGLIALVEPMVNTVAYFFHEQAWQRFQRRREAQVEIPSHHRHWLHSHS